MDRLNPFPGQSSHAFESRVAFRVSRI